MYLVKSLPRDKGSGRYTMHLPLSPCRFLGAKGQIDCVSTRLLVPRQGLYQIHRQSLNTHQGKHRSGGAQSKHNQITRQSLASRLSARHVAASWCCPPVAMHTSLPPVCLPPCLISGDHPENAIRIAFLMPQMASANALAIAKALFALMVKHRFSPLFSGIILVIFRARVL